MVRTRRGFVFSTVSAAFLLLSFTPALPAQQPKADLAPLDGAVQSLMAEWKVPGAAIAIVKDGELVHARGYGFRDLKAGKPVTERTLFGIASCTKSFTAACLAILVDEGKLEWTRPVREYVPEFRLYDDHATRTIAPRDLLSHRSGVPRHDWVWIGASIDRKEMFDRLRFLQPTKSLYAEYQYNNLMYMAAGVLLQRLTGKSWEEFLRERLLGPLEMKATVLTYPEMRKNDDHALSYREEKGEPVEAGFASNVDAIGPAGGVKSSVAEMANWLKLQLDRGRFGGKALVSEKNLMETRTPQGVVLPPERKYAELGYAAYGMGWNINTYRGQLFLYHGGSIEGYRNMMTLLPDLSAGIIVLTNTGAAEYYFTRAVTYRAADLLMRQPEIDWSARFKQVRAEDRVQEEKRSAESAAGKRPGTQPSRPLAEFAGVYQHPAYGSMEIRHENDSLRGVFHGRAFALAHYHFDIFEGSGDFRLVKFAFSTGLDGKLDRVTAAIPNAGDIVFAK